MTATKVQLGRKQSGQAEDSGTATAEHSCSIFALLLKEVASDFRLCCRMPIVMVL